MPRRAAARSGSGAGSRSRPPPSRGGFLYPLRFELDAAGRAVRPGDVGLPPAEPTEGGLLVARFASLAGPSLLRLDMRRGENRPGPAR
jgi:hypothetical protein